ncbi:hypothetical protein HPB50_001297 [Hyalomma asiaticum]|uniref:Uncharacterized protein n=1 Tax=Hyalomma asiaticum TaxID=266040 RepID=A0ACB7RLD6_HYAAI|nr:hypothetical protein HPB50_001297 [Hyalomma asiaticum]
MASISADELLIEEVRQSPVLSDQRLKTYRDSQLQYDAWLEISGVLQRDGRCLVWKQLHAWFLHSLLMHRAHHILTTQARQFKTSVTHFCRCRKPQ